MRILRALVGVCLVLTAAAVGSESAPRPSGRLDLHWTGATFWHAYRLKGRYTVWGLSDGSMSMVSSPVEGSRSSVELATPNASERLSIVDMECDEPAVGTKRTAIIPV